MKSWKKCLAVCGALTIFAGVIAPGVLPKQVQAETQTALTAQAAEYKTASSCQNVLNVPYHLQHAEGSIDQRYFSCIVRVEKGQKFNIGDFVQLCKINQNRDILTQKAASEEKSCRYKSENTANLRVNAKTGVVTPIQEGTAKVTVTYKNTKAEISVIIAAKDVLHTQASKYDTIRKKVKTLTNAYGNGITAKNRVAVYNALQEVRKARNSRKELSKLYNGFGYKNGQPTQDIVIPQLAKIDVIRCALHNYDEKTDPTAVGSKKQFQIKSVSGKGNAITVKLKKKITEEQAFALQCYEPYSEEELDPDVLTQSHPNKIKTSGTIKWTMFIRDMKDPEMPYEAEAQTKKGSNTITVKLKYGYKLKKGRNYMLRDTQYACTSKEEKKHWTKAKTFVAK